MAAYVVYVSYISLGKAIGSLYYIGSIQVIGMIDSPTC